MTSPTTGEIMRNPKIAMTAIIAGTVVIVSLIVGLVYLAAKGAEASTLLSLVGTLVGTVNLVMLAQTKTSVSKDTAAVHDKIAQLQEQTNGTQTKLIDAAIAAPPPTNGV